ncbi:MAG: carbohydrate-binding family 9-like protein [Bacteroidales bacterium]|nr:carbohydrate-binding family 9-like protein [Bacteroidales bacterium]
MEFAIAHSGSHLLLNFRLADNEVRALLLHAGIKPDRPGAPQNILDSIRRWSSLGSEPFDNRRGDIRWQLSEII